METNHQLFEIFNRFEKDILYDCHQTITKINRSESFRKIVVQKKTIIMSIAEYLSMTQPELLADELKEVWVFILASIATINDIKSNLLCSDGFEKWKDWACRQKYLEIKTTLRTPDTIIVDISDEACLPRGFKHGDIAIHPRGELEVEMIGVASRNGGPDVLWYVIQHTKTMGRACCWPGAINLLQAGFVKKEIFSDPIS